MEHASRAATTPKDVDDHTAGGYGPDRAAAKAGAGIGLRQIRARSVPIPVPSIDEPVDSAPTVTDPVAPGPVKKADLVVTRSVSRAPAAFPPGVAEKLNTYVYLLVDPRNGRPFFVGSGRGDAALEGPLGAASRRGAG